eukprot:scaffold1350_cov249-Pinguiococcus_pyrenoidosus.AAC.12
MKRSFFSFLGLLRPRRPRSPRTAPLCQAPVSMWTTHPCFKPRKAQLTAGGGLGSAPRRTSGGFRALAPPDAILFLIFLKDSPPSLLRSPLRRLRATTVPRPKTTRLYHGRVRPLWRAAPTAFEAVVSWAAEGAAGVEAHAHHAAFVCLVGAKTVWAPLSQVRSSDLEVLLHNAGASSKLCERATAPPCRRPSPSEF